jgi:hypothetical protein
VAHQIEIDDVALSVNISDAKLSVGPTGCGDEGRSEFLRIGLPDPNRCKYARLIAATRMLRVEAVLKQLPNIDNGVIAVG